METLATLEGEGPRGAVTGSSWRENPGAPEENHRISGPDLANSAASKMDRETGIQVERWKPEG